MGGRRLLIPAAAAAALAFVALLVGGGSARAAASLSISSDQPFSPAFDRSMPDYVVRCNGSPLNVSVASDPTTLVSVDGAAFQSGSFSRPVPLSTGQEFRIRVKPGLA